MHGNSSHPHIKSEYPHHSGGSRGPERSWELTKATASGWQGGIPTQAVCGLQHLAHSPPHDIPPAVSEVHEVSGAPNVHTLLPLGILPPTKVPPSSRKPAQPTEAGRSRRSPL